MSTSCRRSSMRKGQNCTFLHSVRSSPSLPSNKQITSASRLKALSKVGTTVIMFQGSFDGVVAGSVFEAYLPDCRKSRFGQTLRGSSSSAGRPSMRARSRRTILKSSSIAKNCLRSISTWTSGVHRDKESLPNAKVQKPNWGTSPRRSTTPIVPMRRRPRFSKMCETVQCEH